MWDMNKLRDALGKQFNLLLKHVENGAYKKGHHALIEFDGMIKKEGDEMDEDL